MRRCLLHDTKMKKELPMILHEQIMNLYSLIENRDFFCLFINYCILYNCLVQSRPVTAKYMNNAGASTSPQWTEVSVGSGRAIIRETISTEIKQYFLHNRGVQ